MRRNNAVYRGRHSILRAKQAKLWRINNAEYVTSYKRNYRYKIKFIVLSKYAGGKPKCLYCKERRMDALTLDHINNDGKLERVRLGNKGRGSGLYARLKKLHYPKGYQVLCYNCNIVKAFTFIRSHTIPKERRRYENDK